MSGPAIEVLQLVNRSLPTEFTELLAELQRAATCLRTLPSAVRNAKMALEVVEYRSHVQQLGKILPSVQGRLLIEKVRLETARMHTATAAAWAQGSKTTL
jgi:hypothetical protein